MNVEFIQLKNLYAVVITVCKNGLNYIEKMILNKKFKSSLISNQTTTPKN